MNIVEVLLFAVIGAVCGVLSCFVAEKLIRDRIDSSEIKNGGSKYINPIARYVWAAVLGIAFVGIYFTTASYITRIEYAIVFCIAACIAIVDFRIQRIPNQLLLLLLILKVVFTIITLIKDGFELNLITDPIIGFVVGFVVYLFPGFFHLNIGAGDIKYGAVIGFYLGFYGFLQTMIVMGITMAVYFVYLRILNKGGMKTMVPNGPFMSLGVAVSCLFPIVSENFSGAISVL